MTCFGVIAEWIKVAQPVMVPLVLCAGLIAPGWLLGRALGAPAGVVGAFLGSAAILTNVLIALDAVRVALDLRSVAGALAVVCGVLALAAVRRGPVAARPAPVPAFPEPKSPSHDARYLLLLPIVIGLGALTVRTIAEPLSGFDACFRWEFLARQIHRLGTLGFYPPMTAEDFIHYGWCDGIAPLVSVTYLWSYFAFGHDAAVTTVPVVLGQALLLFVVVYKLAALASGRTAALAAMGVLAISPVLLWAVAMGQETGFTALSFAAMFLFIARHGEDSSASWLPWAGLAAGVGALAREYGLAFIALGALTLWWQRIPRRGVIRFLLAAVIVALPWYLRNWVKTGNPLYSHGVGGLFPANPVLTGYMDTVGELIDSRGQSAYLAEFSGWFAILTLLPFVLAGAAVALDWRSWRTRMPWLLGIGAIVVLWWQSVRYTSGGMTYSLRVLSPAIALAAVFAGCLLARLRSAGTLTLVAIGLTCAAVDSAERSLMLPFHLEREMDWPGRRASGWQSHAKFRATLNKLPIWAAIADAAGGDRIIVSDPLFHSVLTNHGAKAVPLFSPEVRFLFDGNADFAACSERLRRQGGRFILLSRDNPVNDAQLRPYRFFQSLEHMVPTLATLGYSMYDLYPATRQRPSGEDTTRRPNG